MRIQQYEKLKSQLVSERSSFIDYWRDLSDNHLSYRGRFLVTDYNKGHKRNTKQINNLSRRAVRTLASGMMAGITSPARPWFRLTTPYPELNDNATVREWLDDVEVMMREVFAQSNLYNALSSVYSELGTFGTGCVGVYEDFDTVVRFRPYTVGSYSLAMNGKNEVDTMCREFQYTVQQLVDEFGLENCSDQVKRHWDDGNLTVQVKVTHFVEPNSDHSKRNPLAKFKRYRSVYYETEQAKQAGEGKYLRESGFDNFPILAPRWDATGEDVYGTECPGMMSLGDTKALQLIERRMAQAVDKIANPPVQAPSQLRNSMSKGGITAGSVTWVPDTNTGGIRSVYDYRPDLNGLQALKVDIEQRINETFYVDLFLMMANSDRRQITAREINERHEEKLLMLGPVLERLHGEMLDPLIDRTFAIMQKAGILPPPPEELQEMELKVEYISILAQAQRMVAVSGIERLAGFVGEISQLDPSVRHKFDSAQSVDEYAEALGVSPRIVRGDKEFEALVQQEMQRRQQAEQSEAAQQTADMVSKVGQVETGANGDNLMSDMMRRAGLRSE